jgi:hypothetical protein
LLSLGRHIVAAGEPCNVDSAHGSLRVFELFHIDHSLSDPL